jgi:histidyl-tRNA synthetase
MKYADRRRAPFAIIEGSDEKARGVVQVKDLVAGAQAAQTATLEEWKDRPAQAEVARSDVVAHLKRLLTK